LLRRKLSFLRRGRHKLAQNHQNLHRSKRRKFRHAEAANCIKRDYLGIPEDPFLGLLEDPVTHLLGAEFKTMFRLSSTRFQPCDDNDNQPSCAVMLNIQTLQSTENDW
jgi:hypothetical protein